MKKKGFTLIELLAVIVILAIIALIATPLVLKYIETAKKDAFKNTIESVERATELKVMQMKTEGNITYPLEINVKDLDLKNKDKLNGTVTLNKDIEGNLTYSYDITDNEYKIYGLKESNVYKIDKTVKLKLKTENGVIDEENYLVYSFYTEGEERLGYETINISDYFETENGLLEFEKNSSETDSTGSKIILKDNNGKVMKVYTVVIFGDVNGDGWIDTGDSGDIKLYLLGNVMFNNIQLKAVDVNNDGDVTDDDVKIIDKDTYDSFSCSGNNGDSTNLVGTTIYYDVDNGKICDTYTESQSVIGIKSGCMRFYVLNDNGYTLDLILDHNTTANVAWSDSETTIDGPKNVLDQLYEDTKNWNGVLTPAEYKVNQTGKTSNANYSIDYSQYNGDTTLVYKARLVTAEELLNLMPYYADLESKDNWEESYMDLSYDVYSDSSKKVSQDNYSDELEEYKAIANEISSSSVGLPKFLHNGLCDSCSMGQYGYVECLTEGYWTATSLETEEICAWYVGNYGYLDYDYDINSVRGPGIRPVITIQNN